MPIELGAIIIKGEFMPESKEYRDAADWTTDRAAVHALVQSAATVELFTIPLYMTALYSIKGLYPTPSDGSALWPGVRPNPTSTDPNQMAFNAIFSVYVQEMLHLQLASNLCTAVGHNPSFAVLDYSSFGSSIPCIGDLKNVPGYEDVVVKLGPLDMNQIKLFMAIEMPDSEANADSHPKPEVPFKGWSEGSALPTFGAIGHLYHCIEEYFDIEYKDECGDTFTLWDKIYVEDSIQVDLFNFKSSDHPDKEYPKFPVAFPAGQTKEEARKTAQEIITAIIDQGEGASATSGVPSRFAPVDENIAQDRGQNDADVRSFWDLQSHFGRFSQVASWLDKVETWPQWIASRGGINPWRAEDLLVAPALASSQELFGALTRANAMNDLSTAGQINEALSHSYSNMLAAMEKAWKNPAWNNPKAKPTEIFPFAAMQALYTRVATIWATGGVPEFAVVTATDIPKGEGHACQGLDPNNPGLNNCANAVPHTCAGANSCQYQGGCGYPDTTHNGLPDINDSADHGGCGAPIPVSQIFHNDAGPVNGISAVKGGSVYDTAWEIFQTRFPDNEKVKNAKQPAPNNLRIVLPPS